MILYSRSSGDIPGVIGQLTTPIKMIIEHESDVLSTQDSICSQLFNIENSTHYGETVVAYDEFGVFKYVEEGESVGGDSEIIQSYKKFIEHIQFMKKFVISAQMMEDANYGIAADVKRRAETFVRSYYRTINKVCETVLIEGTNTNASFGELVINTASPDNKPLFYSHHPYGKHNLTQSNYYVGDLVKTGTGSSRKYSAATFEESLSKMSVLFRNMKDESEDPLGYTADTIIIPSNRPELESIVRKTCGSYRTLGSANNDINLHYGNWNIVVLPGWTPDNDQIMIMSSEANKNLGGNMFFNRIPLTVSDEIDHSTGNYIWTGRCRFGVGFGSYKHIMRIADSDGPDTESNSTYFS